MCIHKLHIQNFRILDNISFDPSPGMNIFHGDNGSGKTSILESIYYLSAGQSFRPSNHSQIIKLSKESTLLRSNFNDSHGIDHILGVRRSIDGSFEAKLDSKKIYSLSTVSKSFPVKIIHPEMHTLISGGPSNRRKFLDWGLFYIDDEYQFLWKNYSYALKQRNLLLKSSFTVNELDAWTMELAFLGEKLSYKRSEYLLKLFPYFERWIDYFSISTSLSIDLYSGWNNTTPLYESLLSSLTTCKKYKTTSLGPHRADLIFKISDIPAKNFISRGQQKLFVFSLIFAQISLLQEIKNESTVLLLDDPRAELDAYHFDLLISSINNLEIQSFLSTTDSALCSKIPHNSFFHVVSGSI